MKKEKSFLIIGMSEFGQTIARKLKDQGADVWVIDKDESMVNLLADDFQHIQQGDCMVDKSMSDLGVENFDVCLVTVGDNFQASLEITSKLKEAGAKWIIAKSYSDVQSKFLKMAGADETVYPEKESAEKIAIKYCTDNMIELIKTYGNITIAEIGVLKDWIGHSLYDLNIRKNYGINVIAIKTDNNVVDPTKEYEFKEKDSLIISGSKEAVDKLQKNKKIRF